MWDRIDPMEAKLSANPFVPLCPRCGYDLRGTTYTWQDACPLSGVCPDCGHEFDWVNVFRARRHSSLLEHQWRSRPIGALAWTLAATLRPGRLWRSVQLEHRVSLPAVAVTMICACLLLLIFAYLAALSAQLTQWRPISLADFDPLGYMSETTQVLRLAMDRFLGFRLALLLCPLLVPLTMPLLFLTLPAAQIRLVHLLRVGWYSVAALFMLLLAWTYLFTLLGLLHDLRMLPQQGRSTVWMVLRYGAPWSPGFLVQARSLTTRAAAIDMLVLWPLLIWWWRCACKHYLKLPNPGLIALLLTLLAGLLALLAQLVLVDGWLRYW